MISGLGSRLFRRALTAQEQAWIRGGYDAAVANLTSRDGLEVALRLMLEAAPYLYRMEGAGTDRPDGTRTLTAHELAARLSYFLTRSAPDDGLRAKADDGSILQAGVLAAEVDRLLQSASGKETLKRFFGEWTGHGRLQSLSFPTSEFTRGLPNGVNLAPSARAELDQFFEELFDQGGKFEDLYLSRTARIDPALASFRRHPRMCLQCRCPVLQPMDDCSLLASATRVRPPSRPASPATRGSMDWD